MLRCPLQSQLNGDVGAAFSFQERDEILKEYNDLRHKIIGYEELLSSEQSARGGILCAQHRYGHDDARRRPTCRLRSSVQRRAREVPDGAWAGHPQDGPICQCANQIQHLRAKRTEVQLGRLTAREVGKYLRP